MDCDNRPLSISKRKTGGFTLVELLVVITIIGILIALLLPAVQAAREAARRLQCSNNLKQLALGCIQHEEQFGHFPTGGWYDAWVGDPDRGFNREQPGSWIYNIMPFIEQQALREMGVDGQPDAWTSAQQNGAAKCIATPLSTLNCPTRRQAIAYPISYWGSSSVAFYGASAVSFVGRSDYVACSGDQMQPWLSVNSLSNLTTAKQWTTNNTWPSTAECTGIVFCRSEVKMSMIPDGTSNTFLLGEKALNPFDYATGGDGGDNETANNGNNNDSQRSAYYNASSNTGWLPEQDTPGRFNGYGFGSAHAGSCNFAFCDGSVHSINYSIDGLTYSRLGNRKDGAAIDAKMF